MLLESQLIIERCPHCNVAKPNMSEVWRDRTTDYADRNSRSWSVYHCKTCGGLILAWAWQPSGKIMDSYPSVKGVDSAVPPRARDYLQQAIDSLNAPAGAVMLAASSVDAMLKEKGYSDGNLNSRINKASADHLITDDMAQWAHEVRLDANDQRHADPAASLPTPADAKRCIDFTEALGMFLFVLPAMVTRGLGEAKIKPDTQDAQ